MHPRHLLALALVAACSSVVETGERGGTTSGPGGSRGSTSSASTTAAASSSSGLPVDAGPDAEPCPPGESASACDPGCDVRDGGDCPCDTLMAPNCPQGWWKVCCAGDGAACPAPDLGPGVSVEPACGPGPTPAWCVSYPMSCHE